MFSTQKLTSTLNIRFKKRFLFISLSFRMYSKLPYMREFISTTNFFMLKRIARRWQKGSTEGRTELCGDTSVQGLLIFPYRPFQGNSFPLGKLCALELRVHTASRKGWKSHSTKKNAVRGQLWKRPVDSSAFPPRKQSCL